MANVRKNVRGAVTVIATVVMILIVPRAEYKGISVRRQTPTKKPAFAGFSAIR
jgi:hypothetical protein